MQAQNLSILSTMGTLGCNPWKAPPPRYNYMYAPCQQGDHGPYCIPPNDMYFTLDGFQALNGSGNLIYSAPTGSANHVANDPTSGLTVNTTLGAVTGTAGVAWSGAPFRVSIPYGASTADRARFRCTQPADTRPDYCSS